MSMEIKAAGLVFVGVPDKRRETTAVILHHAAADGGVEAVHRTHIARGWYGIGYHYYIYKDGSIWRGRDEDSVGAHTVGLNATAIGVCFEGNFEREEMPAAQLEAGLELLEDILSRYPDAELSGHREHDATVCPGKNFPAVLFTARERAEEKRAYELLEKAQRCAARQPIPNWAAEEYAEAVAVGITDGEAPMALMPRWQGAVMALRAVKNNN